MLTTFTNDANYRHFYYQCYNDVKYNSARTLVFKVVPKRIDIIDATDPNFKVSAQIEEKNGKLVIAFDIASEHKNKVSSHIWPTAFTKEITIFLQGVFPINGISASWVDNSKNFAEFISLIGNIPPTEATLLQTSPSYMRKYIEATKKTWTGKLAISLGYRNPTQFKLEFEDGNYIISLVYLK